MCHTYKLAYAYQFRIAYFSHKVIGMLFCHIFFPLKEKKLHISFTYRELHLSTYLCGVRSLEWLLHPADLHPEHHDRYRLLGLLLAECGGYAC